MLSRLCHFPDGQTTNTTLSNLSPNANVSTSAITNSSSTNTNFTPNQGESPPPGRCSLASSRRFSFSSLSLYSFLTLSVAFLARCFPSLPPAFMPLVSLFSTGTGTGLETSTVVDPPGGAKIAVGAGQGAHPTNKNMSQHNSPTSGSTPANSTLVTVNT